MNFSTTVSAENETLANDYKSLVEKINVFPKSNQIVVYTLEDMSSDLTKFTAKYPYDSKDETISQMYNYLTIYQ